jgi:diacylglycerol kinase (ATP)
VRTTLIHNVGAGGTVRSTERMLELLQESGYDAVHVPTETAADLGAALKDPGELVVVAGGDGTVRGVVLALLARPTPPVPLALVPLGTANNIARTLSLTDSPETLLRGLASPQRRPFDLGHLSAPWGEAWFLEAFGLGLIAQGMSSYDPTQGKSVVRAAQAAAQVLSQLEAQDCALELDGVSLSGRYLAVELMNTAAMGLRFRLAPDADPSDGLLDVVLVAEDARVGVNSYLVNLAAGSLGELPNVEVRRGKRFKMLWDGLPLHLDEEVVRGGQVAAGVNGGVIDVELRAGALEFWLPRYSQVAHGEG